MIDDNCPQNVWFQGIVGVYDIISRIDNFSRRGDADVWVDFQNSIHRLSQYFDITFYKFAENHVIFENIILASESVFCHFYVGNRL